MAGAIRIGIGGWSYVPWKETFYPPKWPARRELEHASRHVTAIEVNGTFYSRFKPETFAKWRDETPDGFVFALKANRFATNRKQLGEAGEAIGNFVAQGIAELGDKLGPILWQLAHTKKFDRDEIAAFLALLPRALNGRALRHAIHVRHESFATPAFIDLCRAANVANVFAQSIDYPAIADVTADFAYVRIEDAVAAEPQGFDAATLDTWAKRARTWATGGAPEGLPYVSDTLAATPRDTFVFVINGAKERAPAAAMALIERVGRP
jgi:uncharacterized protein YecE (DUF72 family)